MSFRLFHEYTAPTSIVGTEIATCRACGVLRSRTADGAVIWLRPGDRTDDRVMRTEPVCIDAPTKKARPWGDGLADVAAELARERAGDDDHGKW